VFWRGEPFWGQHLVELLEADIVQTTEAPIEYPDRQAVSS
jgi:hypothetical protein